MDGSRADGERYIEEDTNFDKHDCSKQPREYWLRKQTDSMKRQIFSEGEHYYIDAKSFDLSIYQVNCGVHLARATTYSGGL